jgi:hypothetical protein
MIAAYHLSHDSSASREKADWRAILIPMAVTHPTDSGLPGVFVEAKESYGLVFHEMMASQFEELESAIKGNAEKMSKT